MDPGVNVQFDVSAGVPPQGFLLQRQQNPLGVHVHPGPAGCSHQLPGGAVPAEASRSSPCVQWECLEDAAAAAVALHKTAALWPSPDVTPALLPGLCSAGQELKLALFKVSCLGLFCWVVGIFGGTDQVFFFKA